MLWLTAHETSMPTQILAIDHRHQGTLLRYVRLLQRAKQPHQALKQSFRAIQAHPGVFEIALLHADCLRCLSQSVVSLDSAEQYLMLNFSWQDTSTHPRCCASEAQLW